MNDPKTNRVVPKAKGPRQVRVREASHLLQESVREVRGEAAPSDEKAAGEAKAEQRPLYIIGHCITGPENRKFHVESSDPIHVHEINPSHHHVTLLDRNLWPIPRRSFSERVMARLMQSEAREVNPHFADDYRLAWLTVFYASDKSRSWTESFGPWEFSFCSMFGKHPKKAIKLWLERSARDREMQFGPRKESESVPSPKKEEIA